MWKCQHESQVGSGAALGLIEAVDVIFISNDVVVVACYSAFHGLQGESTESDDLDRLFWRFLMYMFFRTAVTT